MLTQDRSVAQKPHWGFCCCVNASLPWQAEQAHHTASKEKQSVPTGSALLYISLSSVDLGRVRPGGAPCFCFALFSLVPQFFFRCPQTVSAGHYFRYTYQDDHGKSCDKWESFPTKEEAVKRQKQIEHELAIGNFLIPSTVTVAEFLMDWLPKQCSKHKWAPKTYQSNLALIQNLIIPYIGEMQMQKLRPYHIEALYDTLSKTPCGQYVGGKRRDLSPKQQKRTLSGTTLHEVHQLLHNSFLLAVEWGILIKSPVPVEAPKKFLKW